MIDRVKIRVKAGSGGDGVVSFRHEKFVPFGGPDGGDGGDGGSVILRADESVDSLRKFRHKRIYRADNGYGGGSSKKHGRNGGDLVLTVPAGTVVSALETDGAGVVLADLERKGDSAVVACGGRGGWGNAHYVSSTKQAPHIAQRGELGEEYEIMLEMRLIADVGIIGYPNVGKSTLLAAASAAKPKIDSYPFTTIEPVPGFVEVGEEGFVMAEVPGLISGAHLGRGLGHDFLRHVMRTKILIHLISGVSEDPVGDMVRVNEELSLFDTTLAQKRQIVALNKIDLPEVRARLTGLNDDFNKAGISAYFLSAATGQGVSELMYESLRVLKMVASEDMGIRVTKKIFRPKPKDTSITVSKEGDEFILNVPELERIVAGDGVSSSELRWQLDSQLTRLGVKKALEKAGIKPGDKIRCGNLEWEW